MSQKQRIICKIILAFLMTGLVGVVLIFSKNADSNKPDADNRWEQPGGNESEEEPVHIPVIERYKKAWLLEVNADSALAYVQGEQKECEVPKEFEGKLTQGTFVDMVLTDGVLTQIEKKEQVFCDKVIAADKDWVQFETRGKVSLDKDIVGLRLLPTFEACDSSQIPIGYAFTDFWEENGKIIAFAIAKKEPMEEIRVLIMNSGYKGIFHEELTIEGDCATKVSITDTTGEVDERELAAGESIVFSKKLAEGTRIRVTPANATGKMYLPDVKRSANRPGYRGTLFLQVCKEGIVVVNQLPLEEYLYSVVPSEMPATYPMEALKAQAICARTYAYGKMLSAGYPQYGAHVDDSTGYQVYNNINEQEAANEAVRATFGEMLYTAEDLLATTYYYSTSCGFGTDDKIWKGQDEAAEDYLTGKRINESYLKKQDAGYDDLSKEEEFRSAILAYQEGDFDIEEPWYRWNYSVKSLDVKELYERVCARYSAKPEQILVSKKGKYVSGKIPEFSKVKNITVERRGAGGVADALVIETDEGNIKIISEYNIRYCLADGETKVERNDGELVAMPTLLPSGFFVIDLDFKKKNVVGYKLSGGGYGHGVGMSQNGAKNMANKGYTAADILGFFYEGCSIKCAE